MSEKLPYTALITPENLKVDAIQSLDFDPTSGATVEGLNGTYLDVTIRAIKSATAAIESYLDRNLIVKRYNDDIQNYRWDFNDALSKYQHYSRHFPLIEIETSGVSISADKLRMLSGVKKSEVDYFAGYRRDGQDLDILQGAASSYKYEQGALTDLDTLPDVLPYDIGRVAFRLTMYELTQALQNSFAVQTRTQVVAQTRTEITKERADFVDDELSKLDPYKYIAL